MREDWRSEGVREDWKSEGVREDWRSEEKVGEKWGNGEEMKVLKKREE